jgi:hypothetical protein
MDGNRRSPQAGGAIIAGSIIAGVVGGSILTSRASASWWGAALGIAIAMLIWLRDRK